MMDLDTWINGHSLHVNVDIPKSEETLLVLNGAMEFFFFFFTLDTIFERSFLFSSVKFYPNGH